MARYSESLIRALTSPTYGRGLFTAAQNLGSLPSRLRESQNKEAMRQQVANIDLTTVEGLRRMGAVLQSRGEHEEAMKYFQKAQDLVKNEQNIEQRRNLEAAARTRIQRDKNIDNATIDILPSLSEEDLVKLVRFGVQPNIQQVSSGAALVDTATGQEIYRAPFKEDRPAAPPQLNEVDTGNEILLTHPFTGAVVTRFPKVDPNASKEERERAEAEQQARLSKINTEFQLSYNIRRVDDILKADIESGIPAAIAGLVPGTNAFDQKLLYESISGSLGLDAIAYLKEMSATGSTGLGAVSNFELRSLQAAIGNLQAASSEEFQRRELAKIKEHYQNLLNLSRGVPVVDAINWDRYKEQGYEKVETDQGALLFWTPENSDTEYVWDEEERDFVPIPEDLGALYNGDR
jgi:tetratricopeptide (TPR) repeat protein